MRLNDYIKWVLFNFLTPVGTLFNYVHTHIHVISNHESISAGIHDDDDDDDDDVVVITIFVIFLLLLCN